MSQQTTAQKLNDLLVSRNLDPVAKDSQGDANDVSKADRFVFDYVPESGKNYGTVVILLGSDNNLELLFGDNLGKTMEGRDKEEWFDFMLQIKQFATRNFLQFQSDNINKLKHSLAGQAAINESWQGKGDTSWNADPTQARLLIRHKKKLGEGEARHRYVESLFIETADGERYKLGFKNLTAGKAMLEHVRQGGKPYDIRGNHITGLVEELAVLSRFRRANAGQVFEGEVQQLITETDNYYRQMQGVLKHLGSSRGYQAYFESWSPSELTEQDVIIEDFKTLFVKQTIDPRIEQALPVLVRITNEDRKMKEAKLFESWINNLSEGTWSLPETPEQKTKLIELLGQELLVGPDATNATEQLYDLLGDDVLFDELIELAKTDANADARPIIIARMEELSSSPDVAEVLSQVQGEMQDQGVDQDQTVDNMQATADVEDAVELPPQNESLNAMRRAAGLAESIIDESGETLQHILDRFKFEVKSFEADGDLDHDLYEALFDYYFNKGEIPYGTAKGRTGDPIEWVSDKLHKELGLDEGVIGALGGAALGAVTGGPLGALVGAAAGQDLTKGGSSVVEGSCNATMEGEYCPEHGLAECGGMMETGTVAGGMAPALGNRAKMTEYSGNVTNFGLEEGRQEGDAMLARIKSLALIR
jgi:hypothetical protein